MYLTDPACCTEVCPAKKAEVAAESALEAAARALNATIIAGDAKIAAADKARNAADAAFTAAMEKTNTDADLLNVARNAFNNAANEYMRILSLCEQPQAPKDCLQQMEGALANEKRTNSTLHNAQMSLSQDETSQAQLSIRLVRASARSFLFPPASLTFAGRRVTRTPRRTPSSAPRSRKMRKSRGATPT